jgi:hypothetical protein
LERLIPVPKMTAGSRIAAANIQDNGGDGRGELAAGSFPCFFEVCWVPLSGLNFWAEPVFVGKRRDRFYKSS